MVCPEAVFLLRLLELAVIQGVVEAALGQQLLVAALLDDLAVAHHQNQVRIADGAPRSDSLITIIAGGNDTIIK